MQPTHDLNASPDFFRRALAGTGTLAHIYATTGVEIGDGLRLTCDGEPATEYAGRTLTTRVVSVSKGAGSHDAISFVLDPPSQREIDPAAFSDRALLISLGSALVHAADALSDDASPLDAQAFRRVLAKPEVRTWLDSMGELLDAPRTEPVEPPRVSAVVYTDDAGEYRWRAVAGNGKTVGDSAEGYSRRADCLHGLALIVYGLPFGFLMEDDGEKLGPIDSLPLPR